MRPIYPMLIHVLDAQLAVCMGIHTKSLYRLTLVRVGVPLARSTRSRFLIFFCWPGTLVLANSRRTPPRIPAVSRPVSLGYPSLAHFFCPQCCAENSLLLNSLHSSSPNPLVVVGAVSAHWTEHISYLLNFLRAMIDRAEKVRSEELQYLTQMRGLRSAHLR
jgi:hypothetical protein